MTPETCYIIDIGQHKKKNLPMVTRFLRSQGIGGLSVLTEADNTEIKHSHPFYGRLSHFLAEQDAIEIHEPGYEASMKRAKELYEETLSPTLRALRSSSFGWQPETRVSEFDRFMSIVCAVRDPILAKQIVDTRPRYAIFGSGHIPGVIAIVKDIPDINIDVLNLITPRNSSTD